jgi:hypothetical protein
MVGSVLGHGIIKVCLVVVGVSSKVMGVYSGVRCIDNHVFAEEFLLR